MSAANTETTPSTQPGAEGRRRFRLSPYAWVWAGVILLYVVMLVVTPNQASLKGLGETAPYIGLLVFVAIGQALVIMQRGIDFSVVGVVIVEGMILGKLSTGGVPASLAILITLVIGAVIGLVNGLTVVYLRLTPLVATLAANGLYLGIALIISSGAPVPVLQGLENFADSRWAGVSPIIVFAVVFAALLTVLLGRTVAGRRFIASGANMMSARAAGIAVNRYVLGSYVVAGLCYGICGALLSSYVGDARLTMGSNYLMSGIAAVVIGGTPLTGGRGSLVATFGGAVFMALLQQFVLAAGVSSALQMLIEAIVFLAGVALPKILGSARRRLAPRTVVAAG